MHSTLQPGLRHEAVLSVGPASLVPAFSGQLPAFADMPEVFATAMMVGFIGATCIEALRAHLEPCQHTVGTHINVSHLAPTPPGMTVRAVVELTAVERRLLTFSVRAFGEAGLIGEGVHQRSIIDLNRFKAKVGEKARGSM